MKEMKKELEDLFKTNTPNMFPLVGESYEKNRIVVLTPYIVATNDALDMLSSIRKGGKNFSPLCNKLHSDAWENQNVDKRIKIHQAFERHCKLNHLDIQKKDIIFYSFLITYPTNCIYRDKKLVDPNDSKKDKDITDLSCGYAGSPWISPIWRSAGYFFEFLKIANPKEIWALGENCVDFIRNQCNLNIKKYLKGKNIKLEIIALRKANKSSNQQDKALEKLKNKAEQMKRTISKLYPQKDDMIKLKFDEFYRSFLAHLSKEH